MGQETAPRINALAEAGRNKTATKSIKIKHLKDATANNQTDERKPERTNCNFRATNSETLSRNRGKQTQRKQNGMKEK